MISIVVPVYNTGQYLERVISALRAQDVDNSGYEMIFVVDGCVWAAKCLGAVRPDNALDAPASTICTAP